MKTQDKSGLTVDDEPDIVLYAFDLNNCFISMPFIGVEIKKRYKIKTNVIKQRGKLFAPIADSSMRDFHTIGESKNQRDVTK